MPADPSEVIHDLMKRYTEKLAELGELKKMLIMLGEMYDQKIEFPELGEEDPVVVGAPSIRPDQFFGLSQTDAAAALLETDNRPRSIEELIVELEQGGCVVGGANPKNTLYTQLVRSTARFVKLPNGHFGLLDWYPEEKAKRRSGTRKRKRKKTANTSTDTPADRPDAEHEAVQDDAAE